jgi:esterase/lipase
VELVNAHPDINYNRLPVAGLAARGQFMNELEDQVTNITTPTLIIQSLGDPVVDPDGTKRLFEQLASPRKEYRTFDFERHGILMGEGSEKVHAAIGEFLTGLAMSPGKD